MLELGFSIILGFAIASTLCGLMVDGSRGDRILMRLLVYIVALSFILALTKGEVERFLGHAQVLVLKSFMVHYVWLIFGATLAIIAQLLVEGHIYQLWVRLHPQSAPTPEARFGQRAQPVMRSKPISATLVGTSTEYLNSELDLRTDTLIKLCFFTFEDRSALTLSRMESDLRLGTGRRQKAFHKLAASMSKRPKLNRTVHRYCRSINGSSRLCQGLFGDLCRLAKDTGNRDRATIGRLTQAGQALGLHSDDIGRLING